jgi:hypothetical protein
MSPSSSAHRSLCQFNGMADKPLAAAICHAVNRWLVEEYLAPIRNV